MSWYKKTETHTKKYLIIGFLFAYLGGIITGMILGLTGMILGLTGIITSIITLIIMLTIHGLKENRKKTRQ